MFIKSLGTLCLAFVLLVMPVYVHAEDSDKRDIIGTILEMEGTATVTTGKQVQRAAVNMPVYATDLLATGPASRLYVLLIDNTELTLSENGQMAVADYVFDAKDDTDNHAVYDITKGAFLYVSGLVAKKETPDVKVNIPQGSIGIRGTRFWGGEVDGNYGILVGDGEVDVTTKHGKVRVKKGQGTTLRKNTSGEVAPDSVKPWPKEKIDRAVKTVALKAPQMVGQRIKVEKSERQPFLRERHAHLQEQRLEEIKKEVEKENPDLKGKLTPEVLQEMRRDRTENPDKPIKELLNEKLKESKQEHMEKFESTPLRPAADEVKKRVLENAAPVDDTQQRVLNRIEKMKQDQKSENFQNDSIRERVINRIENAPQDQKPIDATVGVSKPIIDTPPEEKAPVEETVKPVMEKMEPILEKVEPKKMEPILDKIEKPARATIAPLRETVKKALPAGKE